MIPELSRLVVLSPPELADISADVREVCASAIGLPPLPAESTGGAVDPMITEFAEQFSIDVSSITDAQRAAYSDLLGPNVFGVTVLIFIADFVPRVRAGLTAIGAEYDAAPDDWDAAPGEWDHDTDPVGFLLDVFVPVVGRMRDVDPVTSEIIRLRGARAHNCRLCKSLREGSALDAGGTESMYDEIDDYESSDLSERHKAALRFVDAMIWQPSRIDGEELLRHFSQAEAAEITLDVMRNACNKIAVALGADAARVSSGTERYQLGSDGQPEYG